MQVLDDDDLYITDPEELKWFSALVKAQNEFKPGASLDASYKAFTGVGSRETPEMILYAMYRVSFVLACRYWTLRSGAAPGADEAFEAGAYSKEIFVPWDGFQDHPMIADIPEEAYKIASGRYEASVYYTPGLWNRMKDAVRRLQARNIQQVLGKNLDTPSKFVLCWTPDGAEEWGNVSPATGGTGTAIWCASKYGIEVINMQNHNWSKRVSEIIDYDVTEFEV